MIEITSNDNVVPCQRAAWPIHRPFTDLSEDLNLARRIINVAHYLFLLHAEVTFSGFVRQVAPSDNEFDTPDNVFFFQVWDGDYLYRTIGYRNFGYVGTLHIEIPEGRAADNIDRDYIGTVCEAIKGLISLPSHYEAKTVAYVEDGMIQLAFPYEGN